MSTTAPLPIDAGVGRRWRLVGLVLTSLAALMLAMDAGMKLIGASEAISATVELGFSPSETRVLGAVLAIATALYVLPLTSTLGAILLTGYLGGAVAIHLQHGSPIPTHVLFGVYVGAVVWAGLWLRRPALRALLPVQRGGDG